MTILIVLVIGIGLHFLDNICEYGSLTKPRVEGSDNNVVSNP